MTPTSAAALAALKSALGDGGWTDDPTEIAPWLTEWRNSKYFMWRLTCFLDK